MRKRMRKQPVARGSKRSACVRTAHTSVHSVLQRPSASVFVLLYQYSKYTGYLLQRIHCSHALLQLLPAHHAGCRSLAAGLLVCERPLGRLLGAALAVPICLAVPVLVLTGVSKAVSKVSKAVVKALAGTDNRYAFSAGACSQESR